MAKKSTAKSTKKKSSAKPAAKKTTAKKTAKTKKTTAKKSSGVKAAKKTTVKKAAASKTKARTVAKKATTKKKSISKPVEKKKEKKPTMAKRTRTKKVKEVETKKDFLYYVNSLIPKEVIMEKRDEIIEQLQNLKDQMLDPSTGEYINENSPYSLHMAEQGTDAMEREKTFLYAQRENKFLGYLEEALKRIEAGTYGICVECIEEPQHLCETCPLIPKARLEAVPHSQMCLPIKQRQERSR